MITDYKILEAFTPTDLETQVVKYLKNRWQLHGSPMVSVNPLKDETTGGGGGGGGYFDKAPLKFEPNKKVLYCQTMVYDVHSLNEVP